MARSPGNPKDNPHASWTTSGAIIKELLNLSSSINLEGEITPVEAWHRLHSHPEFYRLDRRGVEALKRKLSTYVRCCGYVACPFTPLILRLPRLATFLATKYAANAHSTSFGAVLDESVFWHYINEELLAATSNS